MIRLVRWLPLLIGLILVGLMGCSSPPVVKLAPVKGKVLYKNKPVAAAMIQLIPDPAKGNKEGLVAQATTLPDGSFNLETYQRGEGAMLGHYRATIMVYPGATAVPAKYTSFENTPLMYEVDEKGYDNLVIELRD